MKVKGVSESEVRRVAGELGFRLDSARQEGRYFAFVLRMATGLGARGWRKAPPEALRYRKRGYAAISRGSDAFGGNGAVCFHGHRVFMSRLFGLNPDAVVRTCRANYLGAADFAAKWPTVGLSNVGSEWYPVLYEESCDCGPEERSAS